MQRAQVGAQLEEASVATVRPVRREMRHEVMGAGSGTHLWTI